MDARPWWKRIFSGRTKAPLSGGTDVFRLSYKTASPRRGTAEVLDAYRSSPWLHAVVSRISMEIGASFKPLLHTGRGAARKPVEEHPLLDLLEAPNPELPGVLAWVVLQQSMECTGDGFAIIDVDGNGLPVRLTPVPSTSVLQIPTRDRPAFTVQMADGQIEVPPARMLWPKFADPVNPFGRGIGPAMALADEVDTDEYATQNIKAFFRNGSVPDVLVTLEGASVPDLERAKAAFAQQYNSAEKAHRAHFANKKADVQRLDTSFRDMDLVELRKDQRDRILQTWGVPPELFGVLENSNRATIDAARYLFSTAVLEPRLRILAAEINAKLVPLYGQAGLRCTFASPVPEDRDFFIRSVATAPSAFTVGDVRARLEMMPSKRDAEWLNTQPIAAGPTNVPPGKALDALLSQIDARVKALDDLASKAAE
jgi:HK97 family phage portal protein